MRSQDARRELPDEPEPDDADPLADPRIGLADAVQRDRADRRVGRVVERHPSGYGATRFFGTARISAWLPTLRRRTPRGRPGARPSTPSRPRARRRRTSSRCGVERGEPVARDVDRGADPFDARAVDDLLDEVRPCAGLLEEVLLARLDLRALGAGADQRVAVGDEEPAGAEGGSGSVDDGDPAVRGVWATCFISAD